MSALSTETHSFIHSLMGIIHSFPRESAFIVKFAVVQREKLLVSVFASGPIHYTLTWLRELSPSEDLYSLN